MLKPPTNCGRVLWVALFLSVTFPTTAAIKTWDGSSSGNWATGANWSGGTAPAAGDDLVFPGGVSQINTTNNFSPNRAFNSITILGTNYLLRGDTLVLSNDVRCGHVGGVNTIAASVGWLADKRSVTVSNSAATLRFLGPELALSGFGVGFGGNGRAEVANAVTGTDGLTKTGTNVLLLHGSAANTCTGTTTVNAGILQLSKTNVTAIAGPLVIGDGNGGDEADVVEVLRNEQIANPVAVQIRSSGLLECASGVLESIGPLTLTGGRTGTQGATATLILLGDVTVQASSTTARMDGRVSFPAHRTFNVSDGTAYPDIVLGGNIIDGAGNVNLIKNGDGTLYISGYSGLNGHTIIREGVLVAASSDPVGNTVVSNNAVLRVIGLSSYFPIIGFTLTLNGDGDGNGALQLTNGHSGWRGPVVLATHSTIGIFGPTNSFTIGAANGLISGAGGFTKIGDGILRITNALASTYSGTTYVNAGRLQLSNAPGASAIAGNLIVGDGAGGNDADVVRLFERNQIADTAIVTVNSSGWLDMSTAGVGDGETIASLILNNGAHVHGPDSSSLVLTSNLTCTGNSTSLVEGGGYLHLSGSPGFIDVTGSGAGVNLEIQPVLSYGGSSIVKNGTGWLRLGVTTGTPNFQVGGGRLQTTGSGALGFAGAAVTVYPGATLQLADGTYPAISLSINGDGTGGIGAVRTDGSGAQATWPGSVFLNSASTFYVPEGGLFEPDSRLVISGVIGGPGTFTKDGGGMIQLTGTSYSTYTGTTVIKDGYFDLMKSSGVVAIPGNVIIDGSVPGSSPDLHLNAANQIANGFDVTMNGGMFDLNAYAENIGTLNGNGAVTLGPGSLLTVSPSGVTCTFSGTISSPGSLAKGASGTLILDGTNTFSGTTTINAGTLRVNGSNPNSPVTINSNGRLDGTGRVNTVTLSGSTAVLTAGTSPGILTCSNLNAGTGIVGFELNEPSPGSGHDQLDVRGSVNLTGLTLAAAVGFLSSLSNQFLIIQNDGADAVTGTFNGLPQNSVVTLGGEQFRISYTGGTGNDVMLTQISGAFHPRLLLERISGTAIRVLWPTNNAAGFTLQTNASIATVNWSNAGLSPAVVGTNHVVTNIIMGTARFYRLFKP